MHDPSAPAPQMQQALARGWTVLTANQRAARTLRREFDLHQRTLGLTYWQPPSILAWDSWLNGLWRNLLLDGHAIDLLLNPTQEHTLWSAIVEADASTTSLRPVDALAQTAADAWLVLHACRGRDQLRAYTGNFDTQTFRRWADKFQQRCAREHYLTQAQLTERLRAAIAEGIIALPSGLLLVGFDSKTPAQIALLETIEAAGTPIEEFDLETRVVPSIATESQAVETKQIAAAPNELAELAACASWLRERLTRQPDSRIAVIVPAIETIRAEIDRVFRQVLAPELNDVAAPAGTGPYEFSLGVPLAATPMVATALDLLRWTTRPLPLDRVSALLLSPHFAAAGAELLARAEFDAFVLRDQNLLQPELSLDALDRLVFRSDRRADLSILLGRLRALRPLFNRRELASERPHADWAAAIHDLLEAAGWAPPALLDSIEFQTRRKWESALDELASLDFAGVRVRLAAALAALERIAAETLFAPESRHAPIQIMGPLESAGSSFDAVWFLHANDLAWPARTAPNPLLPWQLQRDLNMPGATPALDAAHARRITERIACSAPTIVFSYAQESATGRQRPSPVLDGLALEPRGASDVIIATKPLTLEEVKDTAPILPPPDSVLQGGASILQSQAACGFRAFAEKRLFSSAPETIELGLDARERGNLVHDILDHFWGEVKTQAELSSMTTPERTAQLNRSIDHAFAQNYADPASGWPQAYIDAERQRLHRLLLPWLEFECTRKPFDVKQREEKLRDVSIGPLRLEIRVDRVDTNLSGGEPAGDIILDYKTGAATPKDWLGPRPDAPQLPLYTVLANSTDLAAVAFASVRPGNLMGIVGYEAGSPGRSGILPKTAKFDAPSLALQVDSWREVLTTLAEEFHAGNASVSPKHYPQTCQYCQQRLLCRLNPVALEPDVLEEIEEDIDAFASEENDFA